MRPTDEPKARASIYMTQRTLDEIDAIALERNVSRSELVCELLRKSLQRSNERESEVQ
jgi:metal-responsive CopG/Arc/MetJ family transcriptional regulator